MKSTRAMLPDVPLKECWFARPQLYFTNYLRPVMGGRQTGCSMYHKYDIQAQLMFYSTLKLLNLPRALFRSNGNS